MYSRFFGLRQTSRQLRSLNVEKTSDLSASTKVLNPKTPKFFNIEKVPNPTTSTFSPGWLEPTEDSILDNILETAEGIKDVVDQLSRPW